VIESLPKIIPDVHHRFIDFSLQWRISAPQRV
jgi:hypothetical protein